MFSTSQTALSSALKTLHPIIGFKNTIPILSAVMFNQHKITASNLGMEVSVGFAHNGKIKKPLAIEASSLRRLVRYIPQEEAISLGSDGDGAHIKFNGSDYYLPEYKAEDFPEFNDEIFSEPGHATGNLGLVKAISRVRHCASHETSRYYINGVALVFDTTGTGFVCATDGPRLALMPLEGMPDSWNGVVLPNDLVGYLATQRQEPEAVFISGEKHRAKIDYKGLSIKAKTIDGSFPDVFKVLPADLKPIARLDVKKIMPTLKRIASLEKNRAVTVEFQDKQIVFNLVNNVRAQRCREVVSDIDVMPDAVGFSIGFNVNYLIDALSAFHCEIVNFSSNGETGPSVFTSDSDVLKIFVMPKRV